ncbi:MAG: metallophosphoesterase [Wenzhouxiangellaceae bacterium]
MRIFAISDLHIDYEANEEWVNQLSRDDYQEDVLILAGDLTDRLTLLGRAFEKLRSCFKTVLYVPGNHELWVLRSGEKSSFEKFERISDLAWNTGITMSPMQFGKITIVPLFSWYDYSFGESSEYLRDHWMDYHACNWQGCSDPQVSQYFLDKNNSRLQIKNEKIISFSHFMPRIDLMPGYIPAIHKALYPVLGSYAIDQQLRQLQSSMHIYGHSHFNIRKAVDGVTYINNAYGTPNETRISAKKLLCVGTC